MDDLEKLERLAEIERKLAELSARHRAARGSPDPTASPRDLEDSNEIQAEIADLLKQKEQVTTKSP